MMKHLLVLLLVIPLLQAGGPVRMYNKKCPKVNKDDVSPCAFLCDSDADCIGSDKVCCATSCGSVCKKVGNTGTSVALRPELIILTVALTYLKLR